MSLRFGISVYRVCLSGLYETLCVGRVLGHQVKEMIEQGRCIVGAGACLGMTLKTKRRFICTMDTLQRTIKQRAVSRSQVIRHTLLVNGKTVILAGNQYCFIVKVLHGVLITGGLGKCQTRGYRLRAIL